MRAGVSRARIGPRRYDSSFASRCSGRCGRSLFDSRAAIGANVPRLRHRRLLRRSRPACRRPQRPRRHLRHLGAGTRPLPRRRAAEAGQADPGPHAHADPGAGVLQYEWRAIGPAATGGRVAAVAGSATDPKLYYVGSAGGGVWKSANGGQTWDPVFEKEGVAAIGAVTIDPTNNTTVWVGTGETNPRNDVSYGDGVYKTTDGGEHWTNVGLKGREVHLAYRRRSAQPQSRDRRRRWATCSPNFRARRLRYRRRRHRRGSRRCSSVRRAAPPIWR